MSAENTVDNKQKRRRRRHDENADEVEDAPETALGVPAGKGRATPGRRALAETEQHSTGNFITRPLYGLREYLEGVGAELQKVAWPSREDTRRLTILVLVTTIIASLVLGVISLGFTELFRLGLNNPLIFLIFFVIVGVLAFLIFGRNRGDTSNQPY